MLVDSAALTTSGALGGVAEAFVVHEIGSSSIVTLSFTDPAQRKSETATDSLFLGPTVSASSITGIPASPTDSGPSSTRPSSKESSSTGAEATFPRSGAVDLSLLPKLGGSALLTQLGMLPTDDLAAFVKSNPAAIHRLVVNPPRAASVSRWWTGLSSSEQLKFAASAPELAGNLEGLPFSVRDSANRVALRSEITAAKKSVNVGAGRGSLVSSKHHLEILKQIQRTLHTTKSEPNRQLMTFDPSGDGRAAVVVGDITKADYVSYLVPGMFFTVQGQMYDWTVIAQDLQQQQTSWLKRLATTDASYQGKTAATVAWIGYSTPGVLDITSLTRADAGAGFLGNAVQGVKAARHGAEPYVTVIGHSYGSTTAMVELAKGGISVNALALIGSPGAAAQSASQLSVANDNVYVGEAELDPIVNTAFYGSDPGAASFGAHKMDVSGTTDAITHKKLSAAVGHLGYFDPGSEAMRNLALIGLGKGSLVTDGSQADATRTLASR
ncbi:alpha/beta hydrolase [Lacisediminihabitans changchengi]|uniref:DUF1023 domain-containing protein n=1 Tax=Lacisediminihabitans changchengi TaxID=2787634 RepID=A0A934SNC9_9MICO|nr:alpha/beta hydrolase [Lacisediminihabitans changchengi]MBK4346133.1 hypothetical protein [Lacisediminihabitans changchengi]